jgi:hypothetical protein
VNETDNPYAAPSTAQPEANAAIDRSQFFYVVSPAKFIALYLATFGLYGVYWMYRHWTTYRRATRQEMWPVARAIFSIFFFHSLYAEIDQRLRRLKVAYEWNPGTLATVTVVLTLTESLLSRMEKFGATSKIWMVLMVCCIPLIAFVKVTAQRAANAACEDPIGGSNANFTVANIIFLILGGLFWLLVLIGMFLPEGAQ